MPRRPTDNPARSRAARCAGRVVATLLLFTCACNKSKPELSNGAQPLPAPDRLVAGEPLVGTPSVMGLRVPNGMKVAARFAKTVQLTGQTPLAVITEALREQVLTSHVEVTPTRSVFARVYVRGDVTRRLLRIEAVRDANQTRVQITDITPVPVTQGLSEAERWERAGRNPDGTVKDPSQVY